MRDEDYVNPNVADRRVMQRLPNESLSFVRPVSCFVHYQSDAHDTSGNEN